MGRVRKQIEKIDEGSKNIARFFHPLQCKGVRFNLGGDAEWRTNLEKLNQIFLDKSLWRTLPPGTPRLIRDQWLGPESTIRYRVKDGGKVRKGDKETAATGPEIARLTVENEALKTSAKNCLEKSKSFPKKLSTGGAASSRKVRASHSSKPTHDFSPHMTLMIRIGKIP